MSGKQGMQLYISWGRCSSASIGNMSACTPATCLQYNVPADEYRWVIKVLHACTAVGCGSDMDHMCTCLGEG